MQQVVIAAVLVVMSVAVAVVLNRRRPQAPTQGKVAVPAQLDRADFSGSDRPWLVAVFTSKTCASCEKATAQASLLESDQVAYQAIPWQEHKALHDRYRVEDVPMILLADDDGVVRASWVGAPEFAELSGTVAAIRSP